MKKRISKKKAAMIGNIVNSLKGVDTIKVVEDDGDILYKGFVVTGRLYNSKKRFVKKYSGTFEGLTTALNTNLWNGSVWGIGADTGKRYLIKRVNN